MVIYFLIPSVENLLSHDFSTIVYDKNSTILRVFLNKQEQWHFPPSPEFEIPEKLKTAVIQYEDRYYYRHFGINPFSVIRAVYQNIREREIVSGASTITMQIARLARNKPRTIGNKLVEMLIAIKMESLRSKEEILRLYLENAPYGGNIIGYEAASLKYYGKHPYQLTWSEAATLAVLPNAPGLISPETNRKALKEKRDRLLQKLLKEGILDDETLRISLLEPVPEQGKPFPLTAPHLCRRLKADRISENCRIKTTINGYQQVVIEELLQRQVQNLKQYGIWNAAALVAETRSGKVRAYVGSQDFLEFDYSGQVDGVRSPRSTGSILKPFLYALSMDDGLILPETLIRDIPSYFGTYSPSNANEKFDGVVSAKEALIRSLNVPAVRLLNTYGVLPFYLFLKEAGIQTLFRLPDDYGLPLILGGAEASLWDLVRLFRGLAKQGHFYPLQILAYDPDGVKNVKSNIHFPQFSAPLISKGACYLTLNILRELKRPGSEYYWEQYQNQWLLAWKTGTSYGYKDAWAIGVSPDWTIAVWIGNFSGESNPYLSGSRCAAPLLFDIFNYLPKNAQRSWFSKPEIDLHLVKICQETGFTAGPNCHNIIKTEAPFHAKSLKICPYHKSVFVTVDKKYQVCSLCWEPKQYKKISFAFYPPEVTQYLRERGRGISQIPPHKPDCTAEKFKEYLKIIYPNANARIWLPRNLSGNLQKITLQAAHMDAQQTVYWYLDDLFLGSSQDKHTIAVSPQTGWHVLEIVDEEGRRDRKRFFIAVKKTQGN